MCGAWCGRDFLKSKTPSLALLQGESMRAELRMFLAGSAVALLVSAAVAQPDGDEAKKINLEVGDRAPAFESKDEAGLTWRSADHVGKKVIVVYFYPGDFTPGCTAQAKKFQENMNKLYDQGAAVVGVSGDSIKTHARFVEVYKLTYTLLADEKGELAKKFGVPVGLGANVKTTLPGKERTKLEFKREVTTARWTFIIGLDGKIAYKNTKVDPVKDSQQVEAFLKSFEKE
jgi:peroxiredoxin Q/BCP